MVMDDCKNQYGHLKIISNKMQCRLMPPGRATAQAWKKKGETDPLSHQIIILVVEVLLDHPRKPINLAWQNSTSRGIGEKIQIYPK